MGSDSKGLSHDLEYMLQSNCEMLNLPSSFDEEDISDCRPALLKFMATATPDSRVASDILNHFSNHKDAMIVTPANYFTSPIPGEHSVEFTVDNVPDTVNPVNAKLAYIQVPSHDGKSTELHLVWRVRGFSIFLYVTPIFIICYFVVRSGDARQLV
jgi:extracellular elastinolytic metalloproteinase